MSEETTETTETTDATEAVFTQSDVDRIVKERLERFSKKFADYDDLKAQVAKAAEFEQTIAGLEESKREAEIDALRATVAADHGISKDDRELFLTGTDDDTLTAQAKRLSERVSEQQKQGNVGPLQGTYPADGSGDSELRAFTRNIFNNTADA